MKRSFVIVLSLRWQIWDLGQRQSADNPMLLKHPAGHVFRWEYTVNVINRLGEYFVQSSNQVVHNSVRT